MQNPLFSKKIKHFKQKTIYIIIATGDPESFHLISTQTTCAQLFFQRLDTPNNSAPHELLLNRRSSSLGTLLPAAPPKLRRTYRPALPPLLSRKNAPPGASVAFGRGEDVGAWHRWFFLFQDSKGGSQNKVATATI